MTLHLSQSQFDAALRISQREKGQRPRGGREEEEDRRLGGLRVSFSGLDANRMWRARDNADRVGMEFVAQLDKVLPDWTDPSRSRNLPDHRTDLTFRIVIVLLTAVAGVTVV